VGPSQFNYWLLEYRQIEEDIDYHFIDSHDVMTNPSDLARQCVALPPLPTLAPLNPSPRLNPFPRLNPSPHLILPYALQFRFSLANNSFVFVFRKFFFDLVGLTSVVLVPVVHCQDSYAIAISHKNGWKVVYDQFSGLLLCGSRPLTSVNDLPRIPLASFFFIYSFSGDTRPCKELIEAGTNCTLLIHEATFEDSMQVEATEKKHSTTTEAIKSALAYAQALHQPFPIKLNQLYWVV